jgi:predicted ATPase
MTRAVPSGDVSAPPFVGQAQEVAQLDRHLAGEGPPLHLLAGEPGIGKSRLLREAATHAAGAGWQVPRGGCQRRSGQVPYAPLLEALKSHLRRRSEEESATDLRGYAWLVRLLPALAGGPIEPLPGWSLPPEQERRLLFEAVGRFLSNVAGKVSTRRPWRSSTT